MLSAYSVLAPMLSSEWMVLGRVPSPVLMEPAVVVLTEQTRQYLITVVRWATKEISGK